MESIHQRIKRLRLVKGMSLEKFAKEVGVKWQSAQQWERDKGGTAPSRKRLDRVAEVLGIQVTELLAGAAPLEAREDHSEYRDPKAKRLVGLFYWLTEDEKKKLMTEVEAKAVANRAIAKQIGPKLNPVSDARVEQALKKKYNQ